MKKLLLFAIITGFLFLVATPASSAPIIMEGDYVRTAVGDNGTLGAGYTTEPGLKHDPSGTGAFGVDDYLTPGTPWEMFGIESNETGIRYNNNTGSASGAISTTSLTDLSAGSSYDHYVSWEGNYSTYFSIVNDYYFNDGDERVSMTTSITASIDLTDLNFLRAIDPDPDVNTFGSYDTVNGRGFDSNTDGDFDDAGDIAPEDWVHSEGLSTGLTLGLYSTSSYTHNTGVSYAWTFDPDFYLGGGDDGNGDYTIGIAFDFGDLAAGDTVTFDYAYIMGGSLDTVDIPSVPEPATMLLLGSGLLGLVGFGRKKFVKK